MMADSTAPETAPPSVPARALARLAGRLPLLVLLAGLLAVFVIAYALPVAAAMLAFLVFGVGAAILPEPLVSLSTEAPLADQSARLEGVFALADALNDPCFILDRRFVLLHRNAAARRDFPNIVPGGALTLSLRNPLLLQALEQAAARGIPQTIELHETVPSETWNKVAVAPMRPTEGGGGLLAVTYQSLTELKRVDALRTDFVANASHELRTPLTSLLGFIETLQGPAARDVEAREKFLGIMRAQAERMARLIEDLLSLSRIEMHQHVRPTGAVDVALLLREVREGLQNQAQQAGVAIDLTIDAAPAMVTGDREQLYEVFENLIENAIKYGGSGGRVDLHVGPTTRTGYSQAVSVTDYGPGVPEEHVPRLTERFYRMDAESSRKKKGTGLGLAIVKHIVQRHRGLLTIRSRPGEGLRVEVLLAR
jgi:two-component system phosphate regulon sensor histidine kinase PhoR